MNKPILPYTIDQISEYQKELSIVGSLSNLFSNSTAPMIYYRATENIYCRSFSAKNVSRSDCTADAIFNFETGIGIKTFLHQDGGSYQKIAEFNKQAPLYRDLSGLDLIRKIAQLRNDRIDFTMRNYGLKSMIYHCILRDNDGFVKIYEEPMHSIDIDKIVITGTYDNKCVFTDGIEQYEFYFPKSTLFKRFAKNDYFLSFKVVILSDPMDALSELVKLLPESNENCVKKSALVYPEMVIPLYSVNRKDGNFVAERSGLNQWNANGRARNENEVYIPFSKQLRTSNPTFFPPRYKPWNLKLPNGEVISMTVCQADGKALMSNPNKALGKWLLRDVLKLKVGQIVTYEDLLKIGVDSLVFRKYPDGTYDCDFIDNQSDVGQGD